MLSFVVGDLAAVRRRNQELALVQEESVGFGFLLGSVRFVIYHYVHAEVAEAPFGVLEIFELDEAVSFLDHNEGLVDWSISFKNSF